MSKIQFLDTTLRDGEQSPGVNLNRFEKLEIARQLEALGVDIIEAGFAASSHGDFLGVKEIASEIRSVSITSLSRAKESDILTAWEALKHAAEPRLHIFLATSDIHMKYKLNMTSSEVLETARHCIQLAKSYFPKVQISAEDACRTDHRFLAEFVETAITAGADVINIPDTVGYSSPTEYYNLFKFLQENVQSYDKAIFSCHCHDDLGMAVANSLAAIQAGAKQVECTVNGIGERAGNAALEEIAVALHIREDVYKKNSNLRLNEISKTSEIVSRLTGMVVQKNKAIVGANAFAHESGIHQDGVLKEPTTYEIIPPSLIGLSTNSLILGKHSGRHAFIERLNKLGYSFSNEVINEAFIQFKLLTDQKKEINNDDLINIISRYEDKEVIK